MVLLGGSHSNANTDTHSFSRLSRAGNVKTQVLERSKTLRGVFARFNCKCGTERFCFDPEEDQIWFFMCAYTMVKERTFVAIIETRLFSRADKCFGLLFVIPCVTSVVFVSLVCSSCAPRSCLVPTLDLRCLPLDLSKQSFPKWLLAVLCFVVCHWACLSVFSFPGSPSRSLVRSLGIYQCGVVAISGSIAR